MGVVTSEEETSFRCPGLRLGMKNLHHSMPFFTRDVLVASGSYCFATQVDVSFHAPQPMFFSIPHTRTHGLDPLVIGTITSSFNILNGVPRYQPFGPRLYLYTKGLCGLDHGWDPNSARYVRFK